MNRRWIPFALAAVLLGAWWFAASPPAQAQVPLAVAAYPAAPAAVTYLPERRGVFGQRLVYRPYITYPAPVVAYYPPPAQVLYYAPAPTAVVVPQVPYAAPPVVTFAPVIVGP